MKRGGPWVLAAPWVVLAWLVGGCHVRPCAQDSLFVTFTFAGAAAEADHLDVTVVKGATVLTHSVDRAGAGGSETLQVDFGGGYPAGETVAITVVARRAGAPMAVGQGTVELGAGCATMAIAIDVGAPVGAGCSQDDGCDGRSPMCVTAVGTIPVPAGYCSGGCLDDTDCGMGGACVTFFGEKLCYQPCGGRGECQPLNGDNRCFYLAEQDVCLPSIFSSCDPTSSSSCAGSGACQRSGHDAVGNCLDECVFGGACYDDVFGQARSCIFINNRVATDGTPTGDWYAGLACFLKNGDLPSGADCTYLNDCAAGLECNISSVGGKATVCAPLCRRGITLCLNGTTCKDAFLLGSAFITGAVGLCL